MPLPVGRGRRGAPGERPQIRDSSLRAESPQGLLCGYLHLRDMTVFKATSRAPVSGFLETLIELALQCCDFKHASRTNRDSPLTDSTHSYILFHDGAIKCLHSGNTG